MNTMGFLVAARPQESARQPLGRLTELSPCPVRIGPSCLRRGACPQDIAVTAIRFRDALIDAGAPPDHDVFDALDRLDGLYAWIVAGMLEVRWAVLVADGVRTPPSERTFTSGASLVAALDE